MNPKKFYSHVYNSILAWAAPLLAAVLLLAIPFFSAHSFADGFQNQYGINEEEQELLGWLWTKAQKFSKIKSKNPEKGWKDLPIYLLTKDQVSETICPKDPENCRGLVGLYDTTRKVIYLREDLNPDIDNINKSFLLHEMVHALQHEFKTEDELFGTCEKLYITEKQAYSAQDAFLKSEGEFFRAGGNLRFFICTDEEKLF